MSLRILSIIILVLSGCATIPESTPIQPLKIFRIGIIPALKNWQDKILLCEKTLPGAGLVIVESPDTQSDNRDFDVFFQFANTPIETGFPSLIGYEDLVWIVHPNNTITDITSFQLIRLYENSYPSWTGIDPSSNLQQPEVWTYPHEDGLYQAFYASIWSPRTYLPQALIAPDPSAMIQAVSESPNAIGYVPKSWLDSTQQLNVTTIPLIADGNQSTLVQPVSIEIIALTKEKPVSQTRNFLLCVASN